MDWISLSIMISFAMEVSGLSCYSCSSSDFNGEPSVAGSCYATDGSTPNTSCSAHGGYCRTTFSFQDGIATSIRRDCTSSSSIPEANKCTTSLYPYASTYTDVSSCYYYCNSSDDCNSVSLSTLKTCGSDCGIYAGRGRCDYISGNCACSNGRTGKDCSTPPTTSSFRRKCIQCNSETDKGCKTKKGGSFCPGSERYCSSTQTSIFKENAVVRTVLIRGCTPNHIAVDECSITDIYSDNGIRGEGYNEYTCYSTCDNDNCNTDTPNGRIDGSEKPLLQCYQCSSTGSDCLGSWSFCPSSSTHCKSTVTYAISDKMDERYKVDSPGSYKLLSVVRECATSAVTSECTETTIGELSLKKVTCQETCKDDGCNHGWPARPRCIRCSGYSSSGCLKTPGFASGCQYPYEKYCVIKDRGLEEGTRATLDGYPRYIVRGCSYVDIGSSCTKAVIRDKGIQSCNYTCSTDGCNVGSGSDSFHWFGSATMALTLGCAALSFIY